MIFFIDCSLELTLESIDIHIFISFCQFNYLYILSLMNKYINIYS